MFQKTLGLSSDPFDPDDYPNWQNLGGDPLRVDQDPKLMELFCWDLGGLQKSKAEIDGFLFYPFVAGETRRLRPGILLIAGGKGTGKTTLASYVKRCVVEESNIPAASWKEASVSFPAEDDPTQPAALTEGLKALRSDISALVGKHSENLFLFVDNLPGGGFAAVSNLYQELRKHSQFYVVTTTEMSFKQAELNWNLAARTRLILTRNVNAAELQAYVARRVHKYRDPRRDEFTKLSSTFPWAETAAKRLVGKEPDSDQPLRLLNRWLSDEVGTYHAKYAAEPNFDIATLPESDLEKLLIP